MFDYSLLATLAAVLRHGSFESAAQALGVTQSAVSQRIRQLEDRTGTTLINRTQPCTGTPLGLRLARHAENVALLETRLTQELPQTTARIRIAINADSVATWFLPALAKTAGFSFDLVMDDQDHSADWLRRGDVVAAVTAQTSPPQGCDSHPLGAMRYVATASPGFVAQHFPHGPTAETLARAPMLVFNQKDRLQHNWARAQGMRRDPPFHLLPTSQGFVTAAELGLGWGMNPLALVQESIDAGRLQCLGTKPHLDIPLFWQTSRLMREVLAPLTASVRNAATNALKPQ